MISRWLLVASLFAMVDAGCAESTAFDDPWGNPADQAAAEDPAGAVPVPELPQMEYGVTVDLSTGALTKKYLMRGVRWIYYSPAYNETLGELTFKGMWENGYPPVYLYTFNRAGVRIASPEIPFRNNIVSMSYSRSTNILYGILVQDDKYTLAKIDKFTGIVSRIREIPGAAAHGNLTLDEANQRLFVYGVRGIESMPSLWTIDLISGNVVYNVPSRAFSYLYDNAARKLYGLRSWTDPATYESDVFLCSVDPSTGSLSDVSSKLPGVSGIHMDSPMFNENDHVYMFVGIDKGSHSYIFSVDVKTGNLHKTLIPKGGTLESNNLAFPHYDNKRKKLYAMYWQAVVPPPPVIGIVP